MFGRVTCRVAREAEGWGHLWLECGVEGHWALWSGGAHTHLVEEGGGVVRAPDTTPRFLG